MTGERSSSKWGWGARARQFAVIGLGPVLSLALVGCGADIEEAEYGSENREAFLTACTDSAQDLRLVRDVCECTYDEIEATLGLAELAALEESLKLDSLASIPDAVAAAVAECFVTEADL